MMLAHRLRRFFITLVFGYFEQMQVPLRTFDVALAMLRRTV